MWIRAYTRCRCARVRAHTHTRRGHGGERRGPCQFLRASTYALHTYRAHFFASPLLHIIRANNILCIICMPYAALRAKSRNREPHRRIRASDRPTDLSLYTTFSPFLYPLLLSQLDSYCVTLLREGGREGSRLLDLFPLRRVESKRGEGNSDPSTLAPGSFFSRVYFSRIPKERTRSSDGQ